ncbi:hypothetical protein KFE25_001529 [Diacronema lutheri]|uniref:VTT domain-containing protein n=1 Tax=Diacronema lutheri TaxID=2081491 RepID=A0A8J5XCL7_DIALT|nr:hypothetical protein KFE25_001529 [Diacronema lutheri]
MRTRGRRPQREKVGARPQAEDNAYWTRWADWLDSRSPPPSPSPDSSLTTPEAESAVALGALGATAIVSEGIQLVGTGALIYLAKEFAGASDLPGAVDYLSSYFQGLGLAGYALYGAIMAFLQVVPLASAFVLTVSSGVIFGSTAKATALVSAASTSSAAVAFVIARYVLRERLLEVASENKTVLALDRALSKADFRSSLLVIMLLRSSPLLPFSWASYLFGISTVPFSAYILGSWLGTLPAIFAYVQVGELGSEAALSGHPPSWLVYFGIAATLAAITLVGDLASKTLKDLDIDLQD